jgi:hypothetical protein
MQSNPLHEGFVFKDKGLVDFSIASPSFADLNTWGLICSEQNVMNKLRDIITSLHSTQNPKERKWMDIFKALLQFEEATAKLKEALRSDEDMVKELLPEITYNEQDVCDFVEWIEKIHIYLFSA